MRIEQLQSVVLAGIFSADPCARAEVETLVQQETYILRAQALGIEASTTERMRHLALAIGPTALLSNHKIWSTAWDVMLDYAKGAEPPIPVDTFAFALAIWRRIHYADPHIADIPAFGSLVDAVGRAKIQVE